MDFQKAFDAMCNLDRQTRSRYHLTLGKLISALEIADQDAFVTFDDGASPGNLDSYRGYYADLCLSTSAQCTAGKLLDSCRNALGTTFTGYKGGEFVMGDDTPLWRAEYGDCGPAIVDVVIAAGEVVLKCKEVE